jgi:hypothetical protein
MATDKTQMVTGEITLMFQLLKLTKNMARFVEVIPPSPQGHAAQPKPSGTAVMRHLYVSLEQMKKWGSPKTLYVTIRPEGK